MPEPQEEHLALFQTIFHIAAKDVLSFLKPFNISLLPALQDEVQTLSNGKQAFCALTANLILNSFTLVILYYLEFFENVIGFMPLYFYSYLPPFLECSIISGQVSLPLQSLSWHHFLYEALLAPFQGEQTFGPHCICTYNCISICNTLLQILFLPVDPIHHLFEDNCILL